MRNPTENDRMRYKQGFLAGAIFAAHLFRRHKNSAQVKSAFEKLSHFAHGEAQAAFERTVKRSRERHHDAR